MKQVVTVGVYGFTTEHFTAALRTADVRLLLDVRDRRGVRGREYAWANARRLEATLQAAGIAYSHHRELAPPAEMRTIQYREDARLGVGQRSRTEIAPEFRRRYTAEVLDRFDLAPLVASLPAAGATALMCVERDPEACHRSVLAERLASRYGALVRHLRPPDGG